MRPLRRSRRAGGATGGCNARRDRVTPDGASDVTAAPIQTDANKVLTCMRQAQEGEGRR